MQDDKAAPNIVAAFRADVEDAIIREINDPRNAGMSADFRDGLRVARVILNSRAQATDYGEARQLADELIRWAGRLHIALPQSIYDRARRLTGELPPPQERADAKRPHRDDRLGGKHRPTDGLLEGIPEYGSGKPYVAS